MDNYTMIQNAGRRRPDLERAGFAALSRADQADRWAAWQASADMPRAGAGASYTYANDEYVQHGAQMDDAREADIGAEASARRDDVRQESDAYIRQESRDGAWRGDDTRERRNVNHAAEPPAPPKRSFALYNGILARHAQVFGKHT